MKKDRPEAVFAVMLCAVVLCAARIQGAQAADASTPSLYILAPAPDTAAKLNLLPLEAALRAAAVELCARGTHAVYVPIDQVDGLPATAYPRLGLGPRAGADGGCAAILQTSARESAELAPLTFDCENWAGLVSSVSTGSTAIVNALSEQLSLPIAPQRGIMTDSQRMALDEAFERICGEGPSAALPAADKIDEVLTARPLSPEALTAACWPACILGSQDLLGHFQLRGRWLAVPLSWWAQAEKAGAGETPRGRLTGAWVALLCGFPDETLRMIEKVDDKTAAQPLAKALRMFATRDWRGLDDDSAAEATAVEQLAWLWALQRCGAFVPHEEAVDGIMRSRWSAAFGPLYGNQSVGGGHTFSTVMAALGATGGLYGALGLESVPAADREELVARIADYHGIAPSGEFAARLGAVCQATFGRLQFADVETQIVGLLRESFELALQAPDGPATRSDGALRWQTLSAWAFAQPTRGLAYQALQLRVVFLKYWWGLPERAIETLGEISAAFDPKSPEGNFFTACLKITSNKWDETKDPLVSWLGTEMGRQPAQLAALARWVDSRWTDTVLKSQRYRCHPCGSWEAEACLVTFYDDKPNEERRDFYRRAVDNDSRSIVRSYGLVYGTGQREELTDLARKMPYDPALLRSLGYQAHRHRRYPLAIQLYEMTIEGAPDEIMGYRSLADAYLEAGQRDKAIETLEKGCSRTAYTVIAGNIMADLAELLAQDGKLKEAMPWARKGAKSFSCRGLDVLATVLHKTGEVQEALEVRRKQAERYDARAFQYLVYAFINDVPHEEVVADALHLADTHLKESVRGGVLDPLMMYGHFDEAQQLLEGKLAADDPVFAEYHWGIFYLMKRDFKVAARRFGQAVDGGLFAKSGAAGSIWPAQQAYAAMCLANDKAGREQIAEFCSSREDFPEWSQPVMKYVAGAIARDRALEKAKNTPACIINLYWVLAAEAEMRGDEVEAAGWYRLAADFKDAGWYYAGCFARDRLAELEGKKGQQGP